MCAATGAMCTARRSRGGRGFGNTATANTHRSAPICCRRFQISTIACPADAQLMWLSDVRYRGPGGARCLLGHRRHGRCEAGRCSRRHRDDRRAQHHLQGGAARMRSLSGTPRKILRRKASEPVCGLFAFLPPARAAPSFAFLRESWRDCCGVGQPWKACAGSGSTCSTRPTWKRSAARAIRSKLIRRSSNIRAGSNWCSITSRHAARQLAA